MKSLKVSVIIPNWNGKKLLEICLASLKRQSLSDFEVTVVDNNSNDSSIKFLQEKYPDIRIITIPQNLFTHLVITDSFDYHPTIESLFEGFLAEFQPDLVHIQHLAGTSSGIPAIIQKKGLPREQPHK